MDESRATHVGETLAALAAATSALYCVYNGFHSSGNACDAETSTSQLQKSEPKSEPESEPEALATAFASAKRERLKRRQQKQKQWKSYLKRLPAAAACGPRAAAAAKGFQSAKEYSPESHVSSEQIAKQRKERKQQRKELKLAGFPSAERCAFPIKHRTCSRPRMKGSRFCLTHRSEDENQSGSAGPANGPASSDAKHRVCCELCGTSMWSDRLRAHTPRCNATKRSQAQQGLSCWSPGVNSGPEPTFTGDVEPPPKDSVRSLRRRVQAAYSRHVALVDTLAAQNRKLLGSSKPDVLLELAAQSSATADDTVTQKHLQQQSSIIGHMRDRGLVGASADDSDDEPKVDSRWTFVEFGAGKGMLSLGVNADEPGADLLLVERDSSSTRTNADRVLRNRTKPGRFERLQIDIRDFNLAQYAPHQDAKPNLQDTRAAASFQKPVVGMSKHLCGVATDLALRCLVNYHHHCQRQQPPGTEIDDSYCRPCVVQPVEDPCSSGVRGIAIALCCHGLCEWKDYVGRNFWLSELGFSAEDFERVKRFSSWATGARKKATNEAAEAKAAAAVEERADERVADIAEFDGGGAKQAVASDHLLKAWEMVEFGRQCKRLIDAGRLDYVRRELPHLAPGASLVTYCTEEITPENCLLIAAVPAQVTTTR